MILDDLNAEVIIGITFESRIAISTDFILPIYFRDRGPHIMRMKALFRDDMFKSDHSTVFNPDGGFKESEYMGREGYTRLVKRDFRVGLVCEDPIIVVVAMWVECNLLLI
jgi:hypothetical protein